MRPLNGSLIRFWVVVPLMLALGLSDLHAADRFVALDNPGASAPYTNWATAATTIQAAIDVAEDGDTVIVSNGVYQTGGRVAEPSALTNRVVIDKPIAVQSVNGPEFTTIRGAWHPITTNGNAAVRCVWMTNGATLIGFTLTNGATRASGTLSSEQSGGGLWAQSAAAVVSNCILTGNSATRGGGAFNGTLNHCALTGNLAGSQGGGAENSTLNHCALTGNSAGSQGGGADNSALNNCTLTGNSANNGGGAHFSTLNNCTLTGNSASTNGGGAWKGNLNNCTLTGNSAGSQGGGADNSTLNNCIVYFNDAPTGPNVFISQINNTCTTPFPLGGSGNITNDPQFISLATTNLQLAAGSPCINRGHNPDAPGTTDLAGNPRIAFGTVDMGAYEYQGPAVPPGSVLYVALNNPTPVSPYATWQAAATNIQDAIDVSVNGTTVLVSNGVYQTGGRVAPGSMLTNRVVIDKPITVQSVNGPDSTFIVGAGPLGDAAVRCVWMTNGVTLFGFTLTNGATRTSGSLSTEQSGGGFWAQSAVDVGNCALTGNSANRGGGAFRGTLNSCTLTGNTADYGGGAVNAIVNRSTLAGNTANFDGGGAFESTLNFCTLAGNSASSNGGGAFNSALNNSLLTGNSTGSDGGGAFNSTLNNCTLTGNSAGSQGGGADNSALNNCIVYFNTAPNDPNYFSGTINYTCTTPMPGGGMGNITNDPMFVSLATTNLQLSAGSPCRDMGNNANAPSFVDIIGSPRIAHTFVDMGAYEFQGSPPGDYDGDGMSNTDERIAGSDPLNAGDIWGVDAITGPASVSFDTLIGRLYAVDRNDDLLAAPHVWTEFTNNIPGNGGPVVINDPLPGTNRNYRVRAGLAP